MTNPSKPVELISLSVMRTSIALYKKQKRIRFFSLYKRSSWGSPGAQSGDVQA
jgi:hypothetical protein